MEVRSSDRVADRSGRLQPPFCHRPRNHLADTALDNGRQALVDQIDLVLIWVDANHLVPTSCQAAR